MLTPYKELIGINLFLLGAMILFVILALFPIGAFLAFGLLFPFAGVLMAVVIGLSSMLIINFSYRVFVYNQYANYLKREDTPLSTQILFETANTTEDEKLNDKSSVSLSTQEDKAEKNNSSNSITLDQYFNETQQFIFDTHEAIRNETFKNPEVFASIEERFKALKKEYYQLARIYHPDINGSENEEHFKQLGNYYKDIGATFERLKTLHGEEDILEIFKSIDETISKIRVQQVQMLRYLAEMEKERDVCSNFFCAAESFFRQFINNHDGSKLPLSTIISSPKQ